MELGGEYVSTIGDMDVRLNLITNNFKSGMSQASEALGRFVRTTVSDFQRVNNAAEDASNSTSLFQSKWSKNWKDVARMAQGIIFSQAFYKIASDIREASNAIKDFSRDCEDAQASFSILMKDSEKAKNFVGFLQDFAAETPFTTQQAITNARSLLSYGFKAEQLGTLMKSISDASAAAGDSQAFDRIARALGQIHTKGKLSQQELLQLTEAGIPAFEILQEQMGLTKDQLGEIAKLNIPADEAIIAIVRGMNARYAGASDALANTTRGMLSTIKDDLLIIASEIAAPINMLFKSFIRPIRDSLDKLREIVRQSGLGGLVREIVPADMLPQIQLLAANLEAIAISCLQLIAALRPVLSEFGRFGIIVLNAVLPFVQVLTQVLAVLAQMMTSNSVAVRVFVSALGGIWIASKVTNLLFGLGAALRSLFIVKFVTQGIVTLAKALSFLASAIAGNPLLGFIAIAAGGLIALAMHSRTVSDWFTKMGSGISKAFGSDPSKKFTPAMKKNTDTAEQFNEQIGKSSDKLEDMGDAAKKAGKKAKEALMAFDEVFNLKDPDEDTTGALDGTFGDMGDLGMPEIPSIDASGMDLDLPDWSDVVDDWLYGFTGELKSKIENALVGAGIGAAIGAILGSIIGGPEGAKWGAILGGLAGGLIGTFWDNFTDAQKWMAKGAGAGALIGGIIGNMIAGPLGAAIGAALGSIIGGLIGNWWSGLTDEQKWGAGIGASAGAIIGGIIGALIGGPIGAAVGATLGGVVGGLIGAWWAELTSEQRWGAGLGASYGAIIGGIIGSLIAPGMGTAIGAALGGVIGMITGKWWTDLTTEQHWSVGAGAGAGALIGGIIGTIICPGLGTAVGAALGGTIGGIIGRFWNDMSNAWENSTGGGSLAGAVAGMVVGTLIGGPIGTVVGNILGSNWKVITEWIGNTATAMNDWCSDVYQKIMNWSSGTNTEIKKWSETAGQRFMDWCANVSVGFHDWGAETMNNFNTWCSETGSDIAEWCSSRYSDFTTWCANVKTAFEGWKSETKNKISTWVSQTSSDFVSWTTKNKNKFDTWTNDVKTTLVRWASDTGTNISGWKTNTANIIVQWSSETGSTLSSWSRGAASTIQEWVGTALRSFRSWAGDAKSAISGFWDETVSGFGTWYANTTKKISEWCSSVVDKFRNAVKKVKEIFSDEDVDDSSDGSSRRSSRLGGHARGGIFNKEHIARFAEGNRPEAIIPLDNAGAMQPFVDAVAGSLQSTFQGAFEQGMAAAVAMNSGPSMIEENHYEIGTLIADDRSLRKLNEKLDKLKKESGRGRA